MARMLRLTLLNAAVLALVGGGAEAQAAAVADLVRTEPFSVVGGDTAAVALPQFDPALGALNAVSVTETASDQFTLEIFNSGAGGSFTAAAQNSFVFGLGGPPIQPGFLSAAGTIPAGMPIFTTLVPAVPLGTPTLFFGPNADAAFIGTGTLDTSVSLSLATVSQSSGATITGLLAFAGATGSVSVDYAFTPVAPVTVPEPTSTGLFGAGLLGLMVLRLRSRRG